NQSVRARSGPRGVLSAGFSVTRRSDHTAPTRVPRPQWPGVTVPLRQPSTPLTVAHRLNSPWRSPSRSLLKSFSNVGGRTSTIPSPARRRQVMTEPCSLAGTSVLSFFLGVAVRYPVHPLGSCRAPLLGLAWPSVHLKPKKPTRIESMLPASGVGVAAGVG